MRVRTTDASAADLLSAWKRHTRTALAATLEHRHLSAQKHYRHAQQLGLQLLGAEPGDIADDDRVAAFVVAHLNLADAFAAAGQPGSSSECLHEAQQTLMSLLQQGCASPSLSLAIYLAARAGTVQQTLMPPRASAPRHPLSPSLSPPATGSPALPASSP
ncbi:DUF2753 domain-containing protein [Comamonas testosteroni]|uniref:DUF2753 domain-containing protein n=1 Tax=Comamonas testosteroni TaxID=285 RepID=UPI000ADA4C8E|nr:DUF2753 domain-containing protein [Comamonas testosteroni]